MIKLDYQKLEIAFHHGGKILITEEEYKILVNNSKAYDQIMSINSNKAQYLLHEIVSELTKDEDEDGLSIYEIVDKLSELKTFILKAQATEHQLKVITENWKEAEQELAELNENHKLAIQRLKQSDIDHYGISKVDYVLEVLENKGSE